VVIAVTLARGDTGPLLWLPTIASSLSLLSLGVLSLTHAMESETDEAAPELPPRDVDEEKDRTIVAALDAYVETNKPHLDPDLTLSRLSRKLLIPAKQLSAAINRVKAENVSRYINRKRIEEACAHLARSGNVTAAMLESGFNTKSNFNREFLRVTGVNPSKWLRQHQQASAESLEASG
jgi:AraC-like DNA-binding protein